MSTQKQLVTVRDLVEEAKKRVVILVVCVVGLSYLMSLTSSSVWVNLPAAACLIIFIRYFALDLEMKRKAAVYSNKPSSPNESSLKKPPEFPKSAPRSDWRSKVNSHIVEDAINHFTRHLVSEWVTDLWYSRITPDKEGPEELVQIINGVFGEFSRRLRNLNLIDLLTRDLIHIVCRHLELFRSCQAKIEMQNKKTLTIEGREVELRRVMAAENKLHPALFSSESEHKVLQHLVAGLISFTFRHEDLQCAFFRYTVRELLACCVMRPVLNLANPRFINERIEVAVISKMKVQKGISDTQEKPESDDLTSILPDHFSHLDPSITGVELVQLKNEQDRKAGGLGEANIMNGADLSKDPLLSMDTRSSRSWNSYPINSKATNDRDNHEGGEWSDVLDLMSRRKTETLEPENLESVWAKGRNYKRKEGEKKFTKQVLQGSSLDKVIVANIRKEDSHRADINSRSTLDSGDSGKQKLKDPAASLSNHLTGHPCVEDDEQVSMHSENAQIESSSSYTSEEEETDDATGLSAPGTKVWDGRANRNLGEAHIHHPLESCTSFKKKSGRGHSRYKQFQRNQSGRKRSRVSNQNLPVWQEVERTSILPGDDKDILGYTQGHVIGDDASDDTDSEYTGSAFSGTTSSFGSFSLPDQGTFTRNSLKSSLMVDSFAKLRCQVLGANIVEGSSKTFAVYSISVADESNHSWSVKRRFRHFEELHRRLKEFPEYNLHLPPKHFLSTGLDIPVIQERCILLDSYLKKLLQLPRVSGSIEVWDFLSVDSQTYTFSSSFSIIDTLSVKVDDKPSGRSKTISNIISSVPGSLASRREDLSNRNGLKPKDVISRVKSPGKEHTGTSDLDLKIGKESGGLMKSHGLFADSVTDPGLPTEWVPPKLTLPLLDLVDVVLHLQEGGWIRRKAFWVAKQVLQLGMGDALDDWLLEKIRLLRRGSVVASGIQRVEQILWPDGIFMTKHPKRQQKQQQDSHSSRVTSLGSHGQQTDDISSPRLTDEERHQERAKFVYELMINKAPATVVSLVGHKEYEHCAKDLYFFLQSSVCLKQLAFDLLELLLLSAFPEMGRLFKEIHEEKHKFGDFEAN